LRQVKYLNTLIEQDHRLIKQRYYPMRGFGTVASAACFCRALNGNEHEEKDCSHIHVKRINTNLRTTLAFASQAMGCFKSYA
jgi:hypothetical protein